MKSLRPLAAALALAAAAHAATPPAEPPGSTVILLGTDSVQKELRLTSLQRAVIDDIRSEYRDASRDICAKVVAGQETKAQGLANLQSLTAGSNRRVLRVLNDAQTQRLGEIRYQLLGGYMLLQPRLQQQLGLTDKQKAKIAKIWAGGEAASSKINTQFEQGKISFQKRLAALRANRLAHSDQLIGVLTPDQHSGLLKLEGEPLEP